MSRIFTINGKRYQAKPFDFNTVCSLEESGVSLTEMAKKPMSMARAYFALCSGGDAEKAGAEIQAHVVSGGNLNEIYTIMGEEMNDSDFFRALNQTAEAEDPTMESEEKKKTK
jgi:hypothetical protein